MEANVTARAGVGVKTRIGRGLNETSEEPRELAERSSCTVGVHQIQVMGVVGKVCGPRPE
jgi:hypothetical protein